LSTGGPAKMRAGGGGFPAPAPKRGDGNAGGGGRTFCAFAVTFLALGSCFSVGKMAGSNRLWGWITPWTRPGGGGARKAGSGPKGPPRGPFRLDSGQLLFKNPNVGLGPQKAGFVLAVGRPRLSGCDTL